MGARTWLLIGVWAMALAAAAGAQPPEPGPAKAPIAAKAPTTPLELDRAAVDVLKDLHNRGAELYNKGEHIGSLRIYEGALLTVRPFLAHHPEIQRIIDGGIAELARNDGVKVQAFRMHEVIEEVRGKLKDEIKKAEAAPVEVTPPAKPSAPATIPKAFELAPPPKAVGAKGATVKGVVTYKGKPVSGAEVVLKDLKAVEPKIFRATTTADGTYEIKSPLPTGEYAVQVGPGLKGPKLPEKFADFATSGLKFKVVAGANTFDISLQ